MVINWIKPFRILLISYFFFEHTVFKTYCRRFDYRRPADCYCRFDTTEN